MGRMKTDDGCISLNANGTLPLTRRHFLFSSVGGAISLSQLLSAELALAADDTPGLSNVSLKNRVGLPISGASSRAVDRGDFTVSPLGVAKDGKGVASANDITQFQSPMTFDDPVFHVLRAEDRLDLVFELNNIRVEYQSENDAYLERIDSEKRGQIIVLFPSQHIAETAFLATSVGGEPISHPPIGVRLADPTRLAFDYVGGTKLPFTLDLLLNWQLFEPRLPASPVATTQIKKPELNETSIEAPYGLYITPVGDHRWQHSPRARSAKGFVEIWNTTLLGRRDTNALSGYAPANVAAVWARPNDASIGRVSIDAKTRRDIVTLSHDANANATSVKAHQLILSAGGANLKLEGRFLYNCAVASSLETWLQSSSGGQDTSVVIERRGFLYPFGHEASLIVSTTRENRLVAPTLGGPTAQGAYLIQRYKVAVRESRKSYSVASNASELPFQSLSIEVEITPPLDEPTTALGATSVPRSGTAESWGAAAFWPAIGGLPLKFPFLAQDWNGNSFRFSAPVIFIEYDATSTDGSGNIDSSSLYSPRLQDVRTHYDTSDNRLVEVFANDVAVARSRTALDTSVELQIIQFSSSATGGVICPAINSQFLLSVPRLQARLPSLRAMVRDEENTSWFAIRDPESSKSELFLFSTTNPNGIEKRILLGGAGQTEKTGGFAGLVMSCVGLSRTLGAVGSSSDPTAPMNVSDPQSIQQDVFNPADYLGGDSTLFGSIRIAELIDAGLSVVDAQMPKIIRDVKSYPDIPSTISQRIDWQTKQLHDFPNSGSPIFVTQQSSPALVPDPNTPTAFTLLAEAEIDLQIPPRVSARSYAKLSNFSVQLAFSGNGVLLKVFSVTFVTDVSGKTDFKIAVDTVELIGPLFAFVAALQKLVEDLLKDTGISIDLKPSGVEVRLPSFNLPDFTVGAFSMQNLSVGSSVNLSFRSEPMKFRFNFSSEDKPFLIAMGIYGGGGSVSLEMDTKELTRVSILFCFGAFTKLDLGIATGSASVLGGLIILLTRDAETYKFYVRASGSVTALGFISVGVDFYIELQQYSDGDQSYCQGKVEVSYSVKIGFFKKSFTLVYIKRFNGSQRSQMKVLNVKNTSRTYTLELWKKYRSAFAS